MERINKPKVFSISGVSALLTGDWHLREDTPVCRTEEEFQKAQWKKVDFISDLQKQCNCPILHSGDLFNHWKPSPWLLSMTMKHLPDQFHTIYGNHDLPQHSLELANKCGINVLREAGKLIVLSSEGSDPSNYPFFMEGSHWNQLPIKNCPSGNRNLLVWHIATYQGKLPWPGCPAPLGATLLRKYPQYDLICTGDVHKPFVEEYKGRLLVNVGSMMRTTADQINYKPCVWLWYAETNTVVPVYLPIETDVISRSHLQVQEERDNRIDSFISRLDTDWKASLSFEDNLAIFEKENFVRKSVMNIVYSSLE